MGSDAGKARVDGAASWLLSAGGDKDETVRLAVVTSLRKIAQGNPKGLINAVATFYFIKDHKELSQSHRLTILQVAETVCREYSEDIDQGVAKNLIAMALKEMTCNPDFSSETQKLSSDLLVALGSKSFCMEVMDAMMGRLEPGVVPHPSLLHCLGALAAANAFGMVPFVRGTLGTLLPSFASISGDQHKKLFCFLIRSFADAIEEYMNNMDRAPDPLVTRDAFSVEMTSAYDQLSSTWIHSRDPEVCRATLEAVGPLLPLLSKSKAAEQLPILAAVLLALYRQKQHHADPLPITCCLCHLLEVASTLPPTALPDPLPEQLLKVAFDQVAVTPDISQPQLAKNHYEALKCIQLLALSRWADQAWEQVIHKLKGVHSSSGLGGISHSEHVLNERIKALWVLGHLISSPQASKGPGDSSNACEVSYHPWMTLLIPILQGLLPQVDIKIKKVLIRVVVALLGKEYLTPSESKPFLEFLISHCSNHTSSPLCCPPSPGVGSAVEDLSSVELGHACSRSLHQLASTVPRLEGSLKVLLAKVLVSPPTPATSPPHSSSSPDAFHHHHCPHPSTPAILRCLALLYAKGTEDDPLSSKLPSESGDEGAKDAKVWSPAAPSLAEALAVYARCFTILGHPFYPSATCSLGINTLIFLQHYAGNLHPTLVSLYKEKIPDLIQTLKGGPEEFDEVAWSRLIVGLLDSSLALVGDAEWVKGVGRALTSLLMDVAAPPVATSSSSSPPVSTLCPRQRSLVFSLLGAVGVWCTDQEFLELRVIETLLSSPYDVTSPAEAEACAAALGRVTKRHPKLVLKALSAKAKDFGSAMSLQSASHGSGGFGIVAAKHFIQRLPFGKASQQANEEARRRKEAGFQRATVTLLLCYGRAAIAISGDTASMSSFLDSKTAAELGAISWILQHLDPAKGLDVRLAALATLRQICGAVLSVQPASLAYANDCPDQNSLGRQGNMPISPDLVRKMRQAVLDQIGGELAILASAIQTLNIMSKLSPPLSSDERITILKAVFDTVFLLTLTTEGLELPKQQLASEGSDVSRVRGGSAFLGEHDEASGQEENYQEVVSWKPKESVVEDELQYRGVTEALQQLQNFVQGMLSEKTCAGTLGEIFTLLEGWVCGPRSASRSESPPPSQHGTQRLAAMLTLQAALASYLMHFKLSFQVPSKITECGWMAGVILPRCTDSFMAVRPVAVSCLRLLLLIVARYDEGLPGEPVLESESSLDTNGPSSAWDSDDKDAFSDQFSKLTQELMMDDPEHLSQAMAELSKITCSSLRSTHILSLVEALLDRGLVDGDAHSSGGASIALNSVLKVKGGYLANSVPHIIDMMLGQVSLPSVSPQTRMGATRSVLVLATHHPQATLTSLLQQALPYEDCVVDCWKVLTQEPSLHAGVLQHLLSVIEESPPYEVQDGDGGGSRKRKAADERDNIRVANLTPLSAISALQEMFKSATMQEAALQLFPELFSALIMALGCYIGTSPPVYMAHRPTPAPLTAPRSANAPANQKESSGSRFSFVPNRKAYKLNPARVAQGSLLSFLLCCGCESGAEALLECSSLDVGENLSSFIRMMPSLTRAICKQMPSQIPRVATCLNRYAAASGANEAQLVTVTAFFSELIALNGNGSDALIEVALEHLLMLEAGESPASSPTISTSSASSSSLKSASQWSAPSPLLRILCLRGLANTASLINSQQKGRRISSILRTLVRGVGESTIKDKAVGSVALEAMQGLSNLLPLIPGDTVREVGVTVALHIRPYLDKENSASLRAASIRLLGNIAKHGGSQESDNTSSPPLSPVETEPSVITSANWNAFEEQVKSNLVCLLLRLADNDDEVVISCKFALREMSQVMEVHWHAKKVASMIQQHLIDNALLQYERFMTDLMKLMVEEFPEDHLSMLVSCATSYLHAPSPSIRGNAALLLGQLFGSMEEKRRGTGGGVVSASDLIPLDSLSSRLSQLLLSDPEPSVRAKTAEAIARLYE
ncbi:maestro heat-like repeat-containing protein family member 1 [Ischnura elegans]|uniref:maestro heat-like repeat-containing protein family member 1 n=1 Tax=Ischnura elegans TaxID=197161 RepID=UPI001ED8696E|nr:maestro heat-like repeat-containing protein family member 1 [Ischnura elegans]